LFVPDPNGFGGEVWISRRGGEREAVALRHGFAENARGVGVLDMAHAISDGRPHRASGNLAFHVLDVMLAVGDSSEAGRHIEITSGVERPSSMDEREFFGEEPAPAGG
jgi:hypothetical protein